jgi:hypothetical protein
MVATCFLLVRGLPGAWQGAAIATATLVLITTTRVPPVFPILAAGVVGAFLDW